ncbi:AI-2E family transporter [uncultured Fusobacterium sp.]|uniref:AI-2E family transporter n=1 Tax=uncultured Fusobacterium sp. TaxID=159267 RepID=UPI0027DEA806|nr:AI-2E family transporter [uncultured Fusobacterium sp.]
MEKKWTFLKFLGAGIILILIQSFFQKYDAFKDIYSTYIGYLIPMIYALFISIFLEPLVSKLENRFKLKRWVSVSIVIVLVIIGVAGFVGLILPQLGKSFKELYNKLPHMQEQLGNLIKRVLDFLKEKELLIIGEKQIEDNIISLLKRNIGNLQEFGISVLLNIMWWTVALSKFFIGFFLAVFILLDKEYFIKFLNNILTIILGKEKGMYMSDFFNQSRNVLLNYVWGRIIASAFVGAVTFIVLFFTGVPYALLSSLMIGIGNMIPYVGSIIAGAIAIFLVILAEPSKIIYLFIAMMVGQAVDGWIVGPRIVSETVGMSTFWVIVAVLIGGSLMGPVGMFFGVPAFGIIKLIYEIQLKKTNNNSSKIIKNKKEKKWKK